MNGNCLKFYRNAIGTCTGMLRRVGRARPGNVRSSLGVLVNDSIRLFMTVGPVGPVGQEKEAKRQTLLEIVECPTKSLEQIHLELADHLGGFFGPLDWRDASGRFLKFCEMK